VNLGWLVFIETKDDGGDGDNWTTGAISRAKLQSNHHYQQTNLQIFTGRMPFLLLKLTWGLPNLSLTTNSSWLPWGRVAMSHQPSDAN